MLHHEYHRGVAYAVKVIAPCLWQWSVFPPDCVKGFMPTSGVTAGTRIDAVQAAKREIDAQYLGVRADPPVAPSVCDADNFRQNPRTDHVVEPARPRVAP
jgi:hypothetical protein